MNMLFITEKFPPSEGGSRVYYYNLCKNYEGGRVFVLTKKVDGYVDFDRQQNFRIARKGKPLSNWKYYQFPRLVPLLLRTFYLVLREKIDVVHCGDFFPGGVIGLILQKTLGKPYVYYVHGEAITWFKQYPYQYKTFRLILKNAARVVAACSYAEEGLKRDYGLTHKRSLRSHLGLNTKNLVQTG